MELEFCFRMALLNVSLSVVIVVSVDSVSLVVVLVLLSNVAVAVSFIVVSIVVSFSIFRVALVALVGVGGNSQGCAELEFLGVIMDVFTLPLRLLVVVI